MTLEDVFELRASARLEPAPLMSRAASVPAIAARRACGGLSCARCGRPACMVLYANASDLFGRPRWIDLCHPCYALVRRAMTALAGDREVLARYEAWAAERAGGLVVRCGACGSPYSIVTVGSPGVPGRPGTGGVHDVIWCADCEVPRDAA